MSDSATTTEFAELRAELAALRQELAEVRGAFTFKEGKVECLSVDRIRCLGIDFRPDAEPDKLYGQIVTGEDCCWVAFFPRARNGAQFFLMTDKEEGARLRVSGHKGTLTLLGGGMEMGPSADEKTAIVTGINGGYVWLADRAQRPSVILGTMPWGGEIVVNFHGNDTFPKPMQAGILTRGGMLHFAIAPEVEAADHEARVVYLGPNDEGGGTLQLLLPGAMQGVLLSTAPGGACVQINGRDAPCVASLATAGDHSGTLTLQNELGVMCVSLGVLEDAGCVTTLWAGQERVRLHATEQTGAVLTFEQSGYPNATLPSDLDPQPPP